MARARPRPQPRVNGMALAAVSISLCHVRPVYGLRRGTPEPMWMETVQNTLLYANAAGYTVCQRVAIGCTQDT